MKPETWSGNAEDIKDKIIEFNMHCLLNPAQINAKEQIGDPNDVFDAAVAEMLCTNGILSKAPLLDKNKKQLRLDITDPATNEPILLWDYVWGDKEFSALSLNDLRTVAWDLAKARAPGFAFALVWKEKLTVSTETEELPPDDDVE